MTVATESVLPAEPRARVAAVAEAGSAATDSADDKLIGIELLRFASALAVLVFHYQHFAFVGPEHSSSFVATEQPFYSFLSLLYNYGYYGVQVFWCISGFIFFLKYGRAIPARKVGGYKFFVLRFSRLYPLHFATLLLVAALQPLYFAQHGSYFIYRLNDLPHFVLQLFMASNWVDAIDESFNGPIWSISIEVLAYFLFYLSLRYVSGSVAALLGMALAAAAVLFFKVSAHPLFTCLMFFYLGCLTSVAYERCKTSPRRRVYATVAALAAIAAVTALQLVMSVKSIYFLLIFTPALILLCTLYVRATTQSAGILTAAGSVTYSSYLLHVPIQLATVTLLSSLHLTVPVYSPTVFACFILGTLVISFYCYTYFEMPAQRILRRRLA
jgi:peptidoglycan/LPS O-acetylase OafA/YrhL